MWNEFILTGNAARVLRIEYIDGGGEWGMNKWWRNEVWEWELRFEKKYTGVKLLKSPFPTFLEKANHSPFPKPHSPFPAFFGDR